MKLVRAFAVIAALNVTFAASLIGQEPESPLAISLQRVISGLTFTVYVTNAGDGSNRLFIIQKAGTIMIVPPGGTSVLATPFLDITSRVRSTGNEQGLLGLAFHPQYETNGRFFVYYTRSQDGAIQIAEYTVSGNANVANTTEKILLTIQHPGATNHNGGTVAFGIDGYLYAGTGDGGSSNDPNNNAQNINSLLGKMLRIDINNVPAQQVPQYNIPPDNPYAGATAGADEIFAIGLRNPYRFAFDNGRNRGSQKRNRLWVADVGQGAIEEVDLLKRGGNYGWRVYEGNNCNTAIAGNCPTTMPQSPPIFTYSHTGGRCSITGGNVYRGAGGVFPRGNYVYGDYCTGEIFMWDGTNQTLLLNTALDFALVAFGLDETGEMYVVGQNGTLDKIIGTAVKPEEAERSIEIRERPNRRK